MQTVLVVLGGLAAGYLIGRLFARPRGERHVRVQPPLLDEALPPPGESARKAAASVRQFGALVERLTARDVVVDHLVCEPGTRWILEVERGADADRDRSSSRTSRETQWANQVSWRAGDEDLHVAKSICVPGMFPTQWKPEPLRPIGPDGDAIGAAEAFIVERFANGPAPDR
jgi:hypothetical protein